MPIYSYLTGKKIKKKLDGTIYIRKKNWEQKKAKEELQIRDSLSPSKRN